MCHHTQLRLIGCDEMHAVRHSCPSCPAWRKHESIQPPTPQWCRYRVFCRTRLPTVEGLGRCHSLFDRNIAVHCLLPTQSAAISPIGNPTNLPIAINYQSVRTLPRRATHYCAGCRLATISRPQALHAPEVDSTLNLRIPDIILRLSIAVSNLASCVAEDLQVISVGCGPVPAGEPDK